jgi:hypothetical protein
VTTSNEATQRADASLTGLNRFFAVGIPAEIDGDAIEDRALSDLLAKLHQDFEVRLVRRAQLYGDWITFPTMPLEYAIWLLLGCDPLETEPPPASLFRRFQRATTLLESEIIYQRLRPAGKAVAGFRRHFCLRAVATVAKRIRLEEDAAAQILELTEKNGKEVQPAGPWQTERVNRRAEVHIRLVQQHRSAKPELFKALTPKKQSKRQRRGSHPPLKFRSPCVNASMTRRFAHSTNARTAVLRNMTSQPTCSVPIAITST